MFLGVVNEVVDGFFVFVWWCELVEEVFGVEIGGCEYFVVEDYVLCGLWFEFVCE